MTVTKNYATAGGGKTQKMPAKLRLKLANECENLLTKAKVKCQKKEFNLYLVHSKNVDDKNFESMMSIFEPLMYEYYKDSSWGWNPREKLSEWKHSRTRIVLVTKREACDFEDYIIANKLPPEEDELVGFMCFRFEIGADKSECALYVYELHIHPDFQRQGLGEELMRLAKCFAIEFKMDKVMLTAFRSNTPALKFYEKLSFKPDKSSPGKEEADYMILSSRLK